MFSYSNLKSSLSAKAIAFVFIVIVVISFSFNLWKQDRIKVDAPSYYAYLPAIFIYHDLHLNYVDKNPAFFKDKIWFQLTEEKQKLIKHPIGLSLLLSPFFLIGHCIAKLIGVSQDGYSLIYQNAVSIGVLIYLFIGLFFLRKTLLDYFSERIAALTLITVVLATNLFWYSTFEGLMPHAVSFSILCICIYNFFNWLKEGNKKHLVAFFIVLGLSVLIRPLAITTVFYFLIIGIFSKGGFSNFIQFMKPQLKTIIIAIIIFFSVVFIQLCYWKYATGKWIYDVYIDEHFVFNSPQIIPFLFSFRKGVFVYTPVLIFAVIGLIRFYKVNKALFYGTVILMSLTIYILSSWWAWSYGICWAMRPMIDYYSFLSLPLAAGFTFFLNRGKIISIGCGTIITLFIILNLFQSWQYKNGLIHFDDMTREAYFKGFFQTKPNDEWYDCLKPYNWERRINGLPQIKYSKEFIESLPENNAVYLKGSNFLYSSAHSESDFIWTCFSKVVTNEEQFYIHHISGDTIAIKSSNGKYLSLKPLEHNIIVADAEVINQTEIFILAFVNEEDNKIILKASNNNYVTLFPKFPFFMQATSNTVSRNEEFRLFVLEDYQKQ